MTDINKLLEMTDSEVPPLPILRLTPVKEKGGLFDSKLGGTPYFPKDMEYPKGVSGYYYKGKPLRLLVQLNFEQLPHIEDFPKKGILQIFLACENDGVCGFDFSVHEEPVVQNGFRVVYHENIITDTSLLISDEDVPYESFSSDEYDFPLRGEFILKAGEPSMGLGTADDFRFQEALVRSFNKISGEKAESYWDIPYELRAGIRERSPEGTAFIGGYPVFTQDDPREGADSLSRFDRVLFELLSVQGEEINSWGGHDYDIIWGDVGTGTFLIPADKLRVCDFSDVMYNFDCG